MDIIKIEVSMNPIYQLFFSLMKFLIFTCVLNQMPDDKMSNYTSTVLYGSLKSERKINKS